MDVLDLRELASDWRDGLKDVFVEEEAAFSAKYVSLCDYLGIDANPDALEAYALERELRLDEERIAAEMEAAELRGINAPDW